MRVRGYDDGSMSHLLSSRSFGSMIAA